MAILRLMARLLLIISVIIIGSRPVYNENFAIVNGTTEPEGETGTRCIATVNYPDGFNKDNCVVISVMFNGISTAGNWGAGSVFDSSNTLQGTVQSCVLLRNNDIQLIFKNILISNGTTPNVVDVSEFSSGTNLPFKIVLMKLPTGNEASQLGDVNLDGEVDQDDLQMIRDYITGQESLNFDQYSNADMNKDGQIKSIDYVILKNILGIE